LQTVDKGWYSSLGVAGEAYNSSLLKKRLIHIIQGLTVGQTLWNDIGIRKWI
jgi:hypothetical protein